MAKFRTPKKDRPTYVYRDAYGKKVAELRAGEGGVTEALIAGLHADDDTVHNAYKRDNYHGVEHYENDGLDEDGLSDDRQSVLADDSTNPEAIIFAAMDAAERSSEFKSMWDKLTDKQRDLIKKKLRKRSNVDIATEEGCTEAAVRNRLAKIQKHFEKFLK